MPDLFVATDMSHNHDYYNVSLPQCIILSNLIAAVSCVYHKDTSI